MKLVRLRLLCRSQRSQPHWHGRLDILVAKLTGCAESAEWATKLWNYAQDQFVIKELGGVWRRPKDGSGATEKLIQTAALVRGGIAVDDTHVYFFTVTSAGQGASSGTLQRVAKSAQNGTSQTIGAANPYAVVSDGTYVYWGDGTNLRRSHK